MEQETDQVVKRYERRKSLPSGLYNMLNPAVWQGSLERQKALIKLFNQCIEKPLNKLKVLEIGCGTGGNLLELIRLGFLPENLIGNELLPERKQLASRNLPVLTNVLEGDASQLDIAPGSLDIVYQSTVFTSLLDDQFQKDLANLMWAWIKPGGGFFGMILFTITPKTKMFAVYQYHE